MAVHCRHGWCTPTPGRAWLLLATSSCLVLGAPGMAAPIKMNVLMLAADDLRPQLNAFEPMEWVGRHVPMLTPATDELARRPVFLDLGSMLPVFPAAVYARCDHPRAKEQGPARWWHAAVERAP